MSLTRTAISGMAWTYSQQFGGQIISFVVSVVLARLILPTEYGLIGMISIFMGIGTALFDGGLTSSLIRSKDVSEDDYSTVFYFNLFGSLIIYLILYILAPFIAEFYNQSTLTNITRIYGLTFIVAAFGTVQNTILTRNLMFKKQAIIALPALILSSATGLVMAYMNFGVWSLIASALVNTLVISSCLWFSSSWYPKLIFSKIKFKEHFHYGYKITVSSVMDIMFTNMYQIIIGRFYSAAQVGFYTRANSLMMLPVANVSSALNKVVFPLFSKVQDDTDRFRNAYKEIMLLVLFIITPIMVGMCVVAQPLILLLFTKKWLPVVPIFQIICFTGILYPIHSYNLIVLQVKGRSDLFLKLEVFKKLLGMLILVISFFYGFYALLIGQVIFSLLALFINTHYAGRMLNYKTYKQLADILPIFAFGILMASITYIVDNMLHMQANFLRIFIAPLCGLIGYLCIAWLVKFQSLTYIKNLMLKR